MGNEVEMEEKYTPYNHKGTKIDGVEPKHRGTPATKRGLSNQQVCIITAIQRFGHIIANNTFKIQEESDENSSWIYNYVNFILEINSLYLFVEYNSY